MLHYLEKKILQTVLKKGFYGLSTAKCSYRRQTRQNRLLCLRKRAVQYSGFLMARVSVSCSGGILTGVPPFHLLLPHRKGKNRPKNRPVALEDSLPGMGNCCGLGLGDEQNGMAEREVHSEPPGQPVPLLYSNHFLIRPQCLAAGPPSHRSSSHSFPNTTYFFLPLP